MAEPIEIEWPADSETPLGDGRFATARERPGSLDELADCVRRRVAEGLAIYPQGGRTALDYGGVPRRPGVAVDMTGHGRVIDYPWADMTITVEAGITLARLAEVLAGEGQRLQVDAPEPDRATVGGVYAANANGPRRFGWGRPRDQILGVGFMDASGEVVKGGGRVVKNVAGYDFPRLLTGSLGTLGIISHVTLKVRPRPEASALAWYHYDDLAALASDLDALNTSGTRPLAIEVLGPSMARRVGIDARDGTWTLAVGFEGGAEAVVWQIEKLDGELASKRAGSSEGMPEAPIWAALRDDAATSGAAYSFAANMRPSEVAPFVAEVDPGLWSCQAHAGSGVVRAGAFEAGPGRIEGEIRRLRALAESGGGNLIVVRCPAAAKARVGVWGTPRPDWAWNERVKAALDPGLVMNPGRFVGTI